VIRAAALTDEVTLFSDEEVPSGESVFGDPEYDEAAGVTVRAKVSPLDATEIEINREVRMNRYAVVLEVSATLDGLSELEWRGERYRIIGEPKVLTTYRGAHHLEIEIRRAEG
jgi:hypothetical protein